MQVDAHLGQKLLQGHIAELNELYLDTLRAAYDQKHHLIIEERFLVEPKFCAQLFAHCPHPSMAAQTYDQILRSGSTELIYTVHPLLLSEQTPGSDPAYLTNFFQSVLTYICLCSDFALARDAGIKIPDLLKLKSLTLAKRNSLAKSIDISTRPRFTIEQLYIHAEQPNYPIKLSS